MTITTFVLSILAVAIWLMALGYNRRSARAAERSAGNGGRSAAASERAATASWTSAQTAQVSSRAATESAAAATAADHRADTPVISMHVDSDYGDRLILQVRNDGHQDLNSVVVDQHVEPDTGVVHPVARTGERGGAGSAFLEQVEVGPIRIGERSRLSLSLGPGGLQPGVRLRLVARACERDCPLSIDVPDPPTEAIAFVLGGS